MSTKPHRWHRVLAAHWCTLRSWAQLDHALEVPEGEAQIAPPSDETKALRGRVRDDLVGQRVALANQLGCLLEQFWPLGGGDFADVDSPIGLEFLDRYPTRSRRARLARSAWPRSWRGTRTAVVAPSPSCSSISAPPRAAPPASSRPRPGRVRTCARRRPAAAGRADRDAQRCRRARRRRTPRR